MSLFTELQWRGLVHQTTANDTIDAWLQQKSRTVYAGFDPTADSLHVGSLLPLMLLRRFQRAGHRPIALAGGATGMIGDPSGKSAERNLLTAEALGANLAGIEKQLRHFLQFDDSDTGAVFVNNFDWMSQFSSIQFLRDIGKHFPVNVMLTKDSVKSRLDSDAGLSYTEFSYMLLQAYDFVHLNQQYHCELQIGGSDQWGNITAGTELARRMHSTKVFGMTCPLLTKADGSKMGKTETGTVWLSPEKTSPFEFYQYWVRIDDADVSKCLRFLTEFSVEQIESLEKSAADEPHRREAQKALAQHLTELVHGEAGVQRAQKATEILYGGEIDDLSDRELAEIFRDVASHEVASNELDRDGLSLIDALCQCSLVKSKGEARRAIGEGGAYINNRKCSDVDRRLTRDDLASETIVVLRRGKRNYALLKIGN